MAGDDRMRLFCALQLPEAARALLSEWQQAQLPGIRSVAVENLHVTLCFLGSRPVGDVPGIVHELAEAAASGGPVRLRPLRYRETRSVAMIVCEDLGGAGARLADDLGERLERIGVFRREQRPWLPHVTVARFRDRPQLAVPAPELGEVRVVRAALYRSSLRPGGARYDALETAALGGR